MIGSPEKYNNWAPFLILFALALIRGLIFISIFPPWLAPDEPAHFEAIRIIGQLNQTPTEEVYQQTPMLPDMLSLFDKFSIWQESLRTPTITLDTTTPPLAPFASYYPPISQGSVVAAGSYPLIYHTLLAPISAFTESLALDQQVYILRLVSLLLTLAMIVSSWFFARMVFPNTTDFAIAATSFIIFLPTQFHINTAINTDVAATFAASVFYLLLVSLMVYQRWWLWLGLVVVTAFGLSIKPTTIFLAPTLVLLISGVWLKKYRLPRALLFGGLFLLVGLTLVGAVALFQATEARRSVFSALQTLPQTTNLAVLIPTRESLTLYFATAQFAFVTFWGVFGWANIHIPFYWLGLLAGFIFVLLIGIAVYYWKNVVSNRQQPQMLTDKQRAILVVLLGSVIFALIGIFAPIIASQTDRWGPPGRYFLPTLLPVALLLYLGFKQILPGRLNRLAAPLWVTIWILFDTATLLYVILPVIYG